jgi:hypothetical protein
MDAEQDYRWIRDVREALRSSDLVEPPEWVRQRARELFQNQRPLTARALIERVRASLIFDSRRSDPALAGVRAAAVLEGPWQLLYRGGDVDIDLLVRPNQDGHTTSVRGQALPLSGASIDAGVVEATLADEPRPPHGGAAPSARSELEPGGEFALPNLERGRYDMLLRFGAREIELSGVEL